MLPSWKKMGVSILCRKDLPSPRTRTTEGHGREGVEDGPTETKTEDIAEATEVEAVGAQGEAKGILRVFPRQAM